MQIYFTQCTSLDYCTSSTLSFLYIIYSWFSTVLLICFDISTSCSIYVSFSYCVVIQVALHMRAYRTFKDVKGVTRKNGEEWLIKMADTEAHIPDVYEEVTVCVCVRVCMRPRACVCVCVCNADMFVCHFLSLHVNYNCTQVVGVVNVTTLTNRQYCIILYPVGKDRKPQLGQKKLIKGEKSFFLQPGERLEKGIQNVFVLGEDEGLILKANEAFKDPESVSII